MFWLAVVVSSRRLFLLFGVCMSMGVCVGCEGNVCGGGGGSFLEHLYILSFFLLFVHYSIITIAIQLALTSEEFDPRF